MSKATADKILSCHCEHRPTEIITSKGYYYYMLLLKNKHRHFAIA